MADQDVIQQLLDALGFNLEQESDSTTTDAVEVAIQRVLDLLAALAASAPSLMAGVNGLATSLGEQLSGTPVQPFDQAPAYPLTRPGAAGLAQGAIEVPARSDAAAQSTSSDSRIVDLLLTLVNSVQANLPRFPSTSGQGSAEPAGTSVAGDHPTVTVNSAAILDPLRTVMPDVQDFASQLHGALLTTLRAPIPGALSASSAPTSVLENAAALPTQPLGAAPEEHAGSLPLAPGDVLSNRRVAHASVLGDSVPKTGPAEIPASATLQPSTLQLSAGLPGAGQSGSAGAADWISQLGLVQERLILGAAQAVEQLQRANQNADTASATLTRYYQPPAATRDPAASTTARSAGVQLNQTTHINVNGTSDSRGTANAVVAAQTQVNQNIVRNMNSVVN